jgi:hypothetical protein
MNKFLYVTNPQQFQDAVYLLADADSLACDTETYALPKYGTKGSALDPHTGRIALLILKSRESVPVVFDILWLKKQSVELEPLHEQIRRKNYLLYHNAKFDLKMFMSTFGYMPENIRDTMIMAKLITNATGSKAGQLMGHGYADLCRDYLDVHLTGKGEEQVSVWNCGFESRTLDNEWWLGKVQYAANDVEYLYQLEDILMPAILNDLPDSPLTHTANTGDWGLGMLEVFQREMQYIPLLAEREYIGMPVSKPMFDALQVAAEQELNEVACRLSLAFKLDVPKEDWSGNLVPSATAMKALRSSEKLKECISKALKFKALDNVQANVLKRIVDILDSLSIEVSEESEGGTSVFIDENEELLYHELTELENSELLKVCPIMKDVLDFKRLSKQVSMDLRKYINPVTGRIHCLINQLGTATGRCIAAGQRVTLVGCYKAIEDVKVGDLAYCYTNEGKLTIKKVTNVFCNGVKDVVEVKWQSSGLRGNVGSLKCTPNHLIKTKHKGWIKAADLERYDKIYHLYRDDDFKAHSSVRPRLYGTNSFMEQEQIVIKKEIFNCDSKDMHLHHIDHNSANNTLSNLELITAGEHARHHLEKYWTDKNRFIGYPKCNWPRRAAEDAPNWIKASKFTLLRMLAEAKGRPTYVSMDFDTFKRKCKLAGFAVKDVTKRYGDHGAYLSKANIKAALNQSKNTEEASKLLGIGTRKLKALCECFGVVYTNHTVTSVRPCGTALVYDLEVEDCHNYIVEELCVHNCSVSTPNLQQVSARTTISIDLDEKDLFRCTSK